VSPDDEAQADTGSSVTPSTNPSEHNTKSEDWLDVPEPDRIEVRTQAFSDGGDEGPDSAAAIVIPESERSSFRKDQVMDRYRLVRRLGSGAFAEVWLAVEDGSHGFRKEIALKLLKRDKADQETLAALLDEARVCGMLQHPHLVDVYGVGISNDIAYIAMEYIRGTTLGALLSKLKAKGLHLPLSVILDIGIQVCQGLDYAHSATDHNDEPLKLVHRDLKPGNLMLSKRSGVKIADFGLAKASTTSQSTEVGILRGTPGYIAPEVWGGSRDFGPHIDLFAVGAILWEMAVGSPLFHGSLPEVIGAAMHGAISEDIQRLRLHQPMLGPVLEGLLQRDPKKRTKSAWEVQVALQELREKSPAPGGLSFFLALVHEDFKRSDIAGSRSNAAALGETKDPQWLKLLDSHGSLMVKLDTKELERRRVVPPVDLPGPTRSMSLPGDDKATLDLRREHLGREQPQRDEDVIETPRPGTLWKAEVVDSAPQRRRPAVVVGMLVALCALAAVVYFGAQTLKTETVDTKQMTTGQTEATPLEETQPEATMDTAAKPKPVAAAKPKPVAAAKPKPVAAAKPKPVAAAKSKPVAAAKPKPVAAASTATHPAAQSQRLPSRGCLAFRSSPSGAKVFLGRKDSGRISSPRSKPVGLPVGRVMVHMDAGANLKLSAEARISAGRLTTVNCNFKSGNCSVTTSEQACE